MAWWYLQLIEVQRLSHEALIIAKPDTVIKWHRDGFRLYWRWKSKAQIGRPQIDKEIRELIRSSVHNPVLPDTSSGNITRSG